MSPKYLITSAGTGSRLGAYSKHKNKALITLGSKPAISHIIDKIPQDSEIIIALGYKADLLQAAVYHMHSDRKIKFVHVDKYTGHGSGLGYTMRCCEPYLQAPFIYIPNDTIIPETNINLDPELTGNWIGTYVKREGDEVDPQQYRCVDIATNLIHPKGIITDRIYIGLCGIRDYKIFWKSMEAERAIEEGESFGLNKLLKKQSFEVKDWYDTGNLRSLTKAENRFASTEFNILPKENEAIWIRNNIVLKYHDDKKFISDRVRRVANSNTKLYPRVEKIHPNIYTYEKIPGQVFAKNLSFPSVKNILDRMEAELWSIVPKLTETEEKNEKLNIIEEFYKSKTEERLTLYEDRFEQILGDKRINNYECKNPRDLLNQIDWQALSEKIKLAQFHGDFHGENIIQLEGENEFKLIDWRQNFGRERYDYGDVYYDLAKFMHGLIVSHDMVSQNKFFVREDDKFSCNINIAQDLAMSEAKRAFVKWIDENGYDLKTVELITALIFLNIAPLHHFPYSKFLLYLGQYLLASCLKNTR